jgi:hypothetical protein
VAVLAGGGMLKALVGHLSAVNAGKAARRRIEAGAISFEPDLLLVPDGMMMGFGWRY